MTWWRGFWNSPPPPPAPRYNPDLEPAPLDDVIQRANAAHSLLNDPTLAECFKKLREEAYADWLDSKDVKIREDLHCMARALDKVTAKLIEYRGAGQVRVATAAAERD